MSSQAAQSLERARFFRTEVRTQRAILVPLLCFVPLAVVPMLPEALASSFVVALVTRTMIFALAAMSLDFLIGYVGLVSLGHSAFVALGAYSVGLLSFHGHSGLLIHMATAIIAAGGFAIFTGAISLRTRGVYFIMITLAFGQMLYFLGTSLSAYGGDDGMSLAKRSQLYGFSVLNDPLVFYYLVFAVLLGAYLLCRLLVASRFGRVLRGLKENPVRMAAIGFPSFRYQLTAYVLSGMIAGIAGVLLANQSEFVSPAAASWQRSGELIFMVVLGGAGSLHGAIVGAFVFALLEEYLSQLTEHWGMIFGPLLILAALFARKGLIGYLEIRR
ncbi:branched-chain amino acid ABC transporter permease [Bradyrhizobium sp. TM239]|uniref:branched-chain amino acid ABC transporter permease n=1 Tax=Bradyrhizobium sp. TM239 TaxID=2599802 RepID=UPI0030C6D0B7